MTLLLLFALIIAVVAGVIKLCWKLTKSGLVVTLVLIALVAVGITGCGKAKEPTEIVTEEVVTQAPVITQAPTEDETEEETDAPTEVETEATTEAPMEAPATKAQEKKSGISDEVKELMEGYEEFVDEYCEFMKNYDVTDISSLSKYTDMIKKLADWEKKISDFDSKNLSMDESLYIAEASSRASKKILDLMK